MMQKFRTEAMAEGDALRLRGVAENQSFGKRAAVTSCAHRRVHFSSGTKIGAGGLWGWGM